MTTSLFDRTPTAPAALQAAGSPAPTTGPGPAAETPTQSGGGPAAEACTRCGSTAPAGLDGKCPEASCRSWRKGNPSRPTHGLAPRRTAAPVPTLDVDRRNGLRDAVLADLGGESEVSAVMRALVEDFANAVDLRDAAMANVFAIGPTTPAGRRRAVLDIYMAASTRVERLASHIGVQRRAKPVDPLDEERRAVEEANRT
jgi:hypothetical protein